MTKSRESGENDLTRQAKKVAGLTKQHVCAVLAAMLAQAKAKGDAERALEIIRAQKYLGCRNIRKRRSNP